MKRTIKLLSLALSLIMIIGMLPLAAFATEGTPANDQSVVAKDYATANDGELLYTVNFKGDDGVFDTSYSSIQTKDIATVSVDGRSVTFSNKNTVAYDFYGGFLKDYRIKGNVYTISYSVQNPSWTKVRVGVQFFSNSTSGDPHGARIGFTNSTAGYHQMISTNAIGSDTVDFMVGLSENAAYIDTNNCRHYKVVVDGISNVMKFYIQTNADGTYSYAGKAPINSLTDFDYLAIGMQNYDILKDASGNPISVSLENVEIRKGDVPDGASEYRELYDGTNYGESLFDVNFKNSDTNPINWFESSGTTVAEDGSYAILNTDEGHSYHRANLPYSSELLTYGNFTYEFQTNGTLRHGIQVLGYKWGNSHHGVGFIYANGNHPTRGFVSGASISSASSAASLSNAAGITATEHISNVNTTKPDATATDVNVKIEFDVVNKKVYNWVLKDADNPNSWTKVSTLDYSNATASTIARVCLYDWTDAAEIKISNFTVNKGLTASDPNGENQAKYVSFTIDGEYETGYKKVESITAFPFEAKPFHTMTVKANGVTVASVEELELDVGYNLVDLTVEYTPVPVPEGLEIRGYQTSVTPTETTTAVRFIGALDNITDYSYVGYLVSVVWKDSNGEIHVGEKTVDKNTSTVYTSILANGKDGCKQITAEELGVQYIVAIAIDGVPIGEGVQVDFTVTPYTVAKGEAPAPDGSNYTKYATKTYSFINGAYAKDAALLNPSAE